MQGGYLAKLCPVRAQNDALRPAEPLPPSAVVQRRWERGRQFEADVVAQLLLLHSDAVEVTADGPEAQERATWHALQRGAQLIASGRLPADPVGRRVGKPDLLLAAKGGGYRAVDVKHHMALEPAHPGSRGLRAVASGLARPSLEDAASESGYFARKRREDLLQLAHYQRMLESAGLAAPGGRFGGIVGVERRVVWYDLDAQVWRTPSSSGAHKMRTTMEVYDFEFDFSLDIIALALQHAADPSVELLAVPVRISECGECPWWDYCRPQLEAGSGDVSLVPRVGWREWKIHRDRGVRDRAALAGLDSGTASLVAEGIDVAGLRVQAEGQPPETPIDELPELSRRRKHLESLRAAGVDTVGDILELSARAASYSGAGLSSLPEQVDQARAALGAAPVYRRRGVGRILVPRADIEVDVDMESVEDGVYLWGALVTDRSAATVSRYHSFVSWVPLTPAVQAANFLRFWTWLMEVQASSMRAGRTFLAYCYNAAAENSQLRRLGLAGGILDQVEKFITSEDWIDMLRVFNSQLITGGSTGLKTVASLAGYSWRVDEPGGAESMLRHDVAVGSSSERDREEARRWLLTYNRGDVEATHAIREWMDRDSGPIPSIESIDPPRAVRPSIPAAQRGARGGI